MGSMETSTGSQGRSEAVVRPLPLAAVTAAVAAVCYSSWLFGWVANPEHKALTGYVSELAIPGEPFSLVFRGLDAATGIAITVASVIAIVALRRRGRDEAGAAPRRGDSGGWRITGPFVLLIVFGVATLFDAIVPLSCAPTSDLACTAAAKAGELPLSHTLHEVTSTAAGAAASVAMAWWWLAQRRRGGRLVAFGTALVVVHLASLGLELADIAGVGFGVLGATQRVSLLALALWFPVPFLTQELRRT